MLDEDVVASESAAAPAQLTTATSEGPGPQIVAQPWRSLTALRHRAGLGLQIHRPTGEITDMISEEGSETERHRDERWSAHELHEVFYLPSHQDAPTKNWM